MNFNNVKMFLTKNRPKINEIVGIVGVVSTIIFASKAAVNTLCDIEALEIEKNDTIEFKEKAKIIAKNYIPTAISAGITIGTILDTYEYSRAAMAAVVELGDAVYDKLEKLKDNKDYENYMLWHDVSALGENGELPDYDEGEKLFYEEYTGRYFTSTDDDVRIAEIQMNRRFDEVGIVWLNDFYDFIGVPETSVGETICWTKESLCVYGDDSIHIDKRDMIDEDEQCTMLEFREFPEMLVRDNSHKKHLL